VILALLPELDVELGTRVDVWTMGQSYDGAFDPRVRVTWTPIPELELHLAGGLAHQPASYLIPLPGIADVPLSRGLQTAYQGEMGARLEVPWGIAELQLFVHRYEGLLFTDIFVLTQKSEVCVRPGGGCRSVEPGTRTNGLSWGGELFLKLPPDLPVQGWISYTLSWSEVDPIAGIDFRPSYDVRHVLSVVGQWNVMDGFTIGARVFVRSGSPRGFFEQAPSGHTVRREFELDAYVRLDAQLAYSWNAGWGRFRVSLDVLNATLSREPIGLSCVPAEFGEPVECTQARTPEFLAPNLGLRLEI
jgi:hypothetical protein